MEVQAEHRRKAWVRMPGIPCNYPDCGYDTTAQVTDADNPTVEDRVALLALHIQQAHPPQQAPPVAQPVAKQHNVQRVRLPQLYQVDG